MKRRRVLYTGVAAGALAVGAGCLGGDDDNDDDDPDENGDDGGFEALPRVEDPPNATYLPSHRDGMIALDTVTAGDFALSPMLSIPHFFWTMPGPTEVDPPADDAVHLMATVWDPETEVVIPVAVGSTIELTKDGESVSERSPWTMISQGMGFHLGDNVPIDGNGTYTATVSLESISDVRLTGELAGRFDEGATATFEFEITDEARHDLVDRIEFFDEDRWGDRDAVPPMGHGDHDDHGDHNEEHGEDGHDEEHEDHEDDEHENGDHDDHDGHADEHENGEHDHGHHDHEMPYSSLPLTEDLPGELLGEPTLDDGVYATTLLSPGSRFVDGDERYLAVSPRTPYNRCVLSQQSLSVGLEREGETVVDEELIPTLDHELNFHYGIALEDVEAGDELHIVVESPPQVSRHQGYETAFLSTGELTLEIEDG
ncbi:DUF7350 domain-containing protein [Natronorubrum sp. DTA28]|uniref:DUF7350 domain-containing protein n=1 Tax=Natronorubrum sp. DTA28 TaxID=3447019 RepID=UPI003F854F9D